MKYLEEIFKNVNIDDNYKNNIIKSYINIKKDFNNLNIKMDENAELLFSNHIISFLNRVKTNTCLTGMQENFNEVSEEAFNISKFLISNIFEEENLPINDTEVFLLSTHIELAIIKNKGEDI